MANDEPTFVSIQESFPILFNETEIPFYPDWGYSIDKVEDVEKSEGGTLLVTKIYVGRKTWPFKFSVADYSWVKTFEEFNEMDDFQLSIYSPRLHAYDVKTVRMVGYSVKPRKHSETLTTVAGVWDVSFSLEAFS